MSSIVFIIFLSFILKPSRGFQVIQPQVRTVNSDHVVSICCEHTSKVLSAHDVRLNRIPPTGRPSKFCPGTKNCLKVIRDGRKYVFVLLVVEPEDMACSYECEVAVTEGGDIPTFDIKKGAPTTLMRGQQEPEQRATLPPPSPSPPPPPPPPSPHPLTWIVIGLLVVMSLYSCLITLLFIRAKFQESGIRPDGESATYVEMRKAARPSNVS